MPVTRPLLPEEDITLSVSTTITGLITKYQDRNGIKVVLGSILGNTAILINQVIESMPVTFTEKAALRGELKHMVDRAMKTNLKVVQQEQDEKN